MFEANQTIAVLVGGGADMLVLMLMIIVMCGAYQCKSSGTFAGS
jgi:hypothetical protein